MNGLDFSKYEDMNSKFTAKLSDKGGYITFSNSGKGGNKKYFTLSLESFLMCLKDILNNYSSFIGNENYVEKQWRDLGSEFYSDDAANAQCTVQTKPMFATLSKIIMWANAPKHDSINPEENIVLDKDSIQEAINKLTSLSDEFTPHRENRSTRDFTVSGIAFNTDAFIEDISQSGLVFSDTLINRFVASLLTKPFVLLTGLSGSGKTKIAQSFARWISNNKSQYKIIPVGSDWTNREPLLGYPNGLDTDEYILPDSGALRLIIEASKEENQRKPYFLILDEMNLSHVERYFADFLSVMESDEEIMLYSGKQRKSSDGIEVPDKISWPQNLFVIGTVNIDETTYMFSPKVLDRANTIEFRIDDNHIKNFLEQPSKIDLSVLDGKGASMAQHFLALAKDNQIEQDKIYTETFVKFFNELKKIGAEFGYRTAIEMLLLIKKLNTVGEFTKEQCIDIALMQKLLPKLHGSRSKISKVLDALISLCLKEGVSFTIAKSDEIKPEEILYPITFEKLIRMYRNALDNGFTSYAEA